MALSSAISHRLWYSPSATRADPSALPAGGAIHFFAIALALSGLAELLLQRVVYRVGVHIPRDGASFETYRAATVAGDFAFRLTAVLLAVTAALLVTRLVRDRRAVVTAGLLALLLCANALIWPLGLSLSAGLVALAVAAAAAWVAGTAVSGGMRLAVFAAATAIALSQFWTGMTLLGQQPPGLESMRLLSETAIVVAALVCAGVAFGEGRVRRPAVGASLLALVVFATYLREPSTFAIVSLWATGITVSLPPVAYLAAFAAAAFAVLSWVRQPATRPMAIGLALLLVAGLQPQALHHGVTALIGLVLLSGAPFAGAGRVRSEASDDV